MRKLMITASSLVTVVDDDESVREVFTGLAKRVWVCNPSVLLGGRVPRIQLHYRNEMSRLGYCHAGDDLVPTFNGN